MDLISSTQCLTGITVCDHFMPVHRDQQTEGFVSPDRNTNWHLGGRVNGQSSCRVQGEESSRHWWQQQEGQKAAPCCSQGCSHCSSLSLFYHLTHCLPPASSSSASVTVTVPPLPQNNLCITWIEYEEDLLFSWGVTWVWISPGWIRKWNVLLVLTGRAFCGHCKWHKLSVK